MSLKKIWTESGAMRDKRGKWYTVGLEGPNATAEAEAETAYPLYALYPGSTGFFASSVQRCRVTLNGVRPGTALVVVHYEPPTWNLVLRQNPGKGILKVRYCEMSQNRKYDLDGLQNFGTCRNTTSHVLHQYVPVVGTPSVVTAGNAMLYLTVALTSLPITLVDSLIGTTNSNVLSAFGTWGAPGHLLFHGPDADQTYSDQTLYVVSFPIEYSKLGWNTGALQVEDTHHLVTKEFVYSDTDVVSAEKKDVVSWASDVPPTIANRRMAVEADWSALNAYLV